MEKTEVYVKILFNRVVIYRKKDSRYIGMFKHELRNRGNTDGDTHVLIQFTKQNLEGTTEIARRNFPGDRYEVLYMMPRTDFLKKVTEAIVDVFPNVCVDQGDATKIQVHIDKIYTEFEEECVDNL